MSREREKLADNLTSLTGGILPEVEFEHLLSYVHDLIYPDQVTNLKVDWDLLPAAVRNDLREAHIGLDGDTPEETEAACRKEIAEMSPRDVFQAFLHYNGIINYTGTILFAWNGIRAASK